MSVASMQSILNEAFKAQYGVPAFNIVNDISMAAVLAAAEVRRSPVVVQVSVKTVRFYSAKALQAMFQAMAAEVAVPATLHLDHCPEPEVIDACIEAGWNSVLFDGSQYGYEQCLEMTRDVVRKAHARGVAVEGEVEAVKGVEDGVGSDEEGPAIPLDQAVRFIRETGIDSFAPGIGTAHGVYKGKPDIRFERVTEIIDQAPIPLVLHGGTGLEPAVFKDLIRRGMAKVNISTQLKIVFADALKVYLDGHAEEYNPLKLMGAARDAIQRMAEDYMALFESEEKA